MNELDKIFELEPMNEKSPSLAVDTVVIEDGVEEDADFNYARGNTYELIEISKAGVQTAMKIVAGAESASGVMALATMLKTAAEMNRTLLQMNKDKADVKTAKKQSGQPTQQIGQQTNNTYVITGTLKDVAKLVEERNAKNS